MVLQRCVFLSTDEGSRGHPSGEPDPLPTDLREVPPRLDREPAQVKRWKQGRKNDDPYQRAKGEDVDHRAVEVEDCSRCHRVLSVVTTRELLGEEERRRCRAANTACGSRPYESWHLPPPSTTHSGNESSARSSTNPLSRIVSTRCACTRAIPL